MSKRALPNPDFPPSPAFAASGLEENHQFDENALLTPAFHGSAAPAGRSQTMSSKAYLLFRRSRPAGPLRLTLSLQPYASLLGSRLWGGDCITAKGASVFSGAKATAKVSSWAAARLAT